MNILFNEGLGELRFGMPVEQVVALLGTASNVESSLNAMDAPLTILMYADQGFTLFFEGENPTLHCIDICDEETTLYGENIFEMNEEELIFLMNKHGHTEPEVEDEDWGERSISYASANADFFFEDSELLSIQFSK